jgi:glyoxylase I family protein
MPTPVFSHIAVSCRDPHATEQFYVKHFGFRRARVIPLGDEQIVFLRNGSVCLELFQAKGEAPDPSPANDGPAYPAWRHIAFQVDDVDATLRAMGDDALVTLGPLTFDAFIPGWKTAWVRDPSGMIVEISQGYRDQEAPPRA